MDKTVKLGLCNLCWQRLILTEDDCWHPHNVAEACPPESLNHNGIMRPEFGDGPGRPGQEHWVDVLICM
jgi:hypothetical protein